MNFRRFATIAFVVLLQAGIFRVLELRAVFPNVGKPAPAVALIFEARAAKTGPPEAPVVQLERPNFAIARAPQFAIDIHGEDGGAPAEGNLFAAALPPRPDPAFENPAPDFPAGLNGLAGANATIVVVAKALVLETGRIGDALVAASSGIPALDAAALAFIKDRWRYLPAMRNGKPISDWISVEVVFRKG